MLCPCKNILVIRNRPFNVNYAQNIQFPFIDNREFNQLRRQLQRKRHIKIELCVKLSLLRLFHVDHVVKNTRIALSLAWYERFSFKGKE